MKWLKTWLYFIVFLCVGAVYLTCVDEWQVYAKPLSQIVAWIEKYTGTEVDGNTGNGDMNTEHNGTENPGDGSGEASGEPGGENSADKETVSNNNEGSIGDGNVADNGDEAEGGNETQGSEAADNGDEAEGENETEGGEAESGNETEGGEAESGNETQGSDETESGNEAEGSGEAVEEPAGPPVYMTVEDDYFADAVFIGDSRTVGLHDYGHIEDVTTFYAFEGMTVYKFFTEEFITLPGHKDKLTVEEALQEQSFAKVYIMLGINEMGGNMNASMEKYAEMVARIHELQPDAIIYLQSIMKVSAWRNSRGDHINNAGIEARNELIQEMADNRKIFYLDINPSVCDEGGMKSDYTYDGVHLKAKYFELWKQFLKEHAILEDEKVDE